MAKQREHKPHSLLERDDRVGEGLGVISARPIEQVKDQPRRRLRTDGREFARIR
jgi:hypothetical protein